MNQAARTPDGRGSGPLLIGPAAAAVRAGLRISSEGFESSLVRLSGRIAIGRGYAGDMARGLDPRCGGTPELIFGDATGFLVRYRDRGLQPRPHEPLTIDSTP